MLESIGVILASLHFGIPFGYYWIAKTKWLSMAWNLVVRDNYLPMVSIIVPTYNEAGPIEARLNNLAAQDYARDRFEIIVVDSASTDGTAKLVKNWAEEHPECSLHLVEEKERKGLVHALNAALHYPLKGEILAFTDADVTWEPSALRRTVRYFSDTRVGAVTASLLPEGQEQHEMAYRQYFNVIRVAESKRHSTPVHNGGALLAFRAELLFKIGGLPDYTGNNDSTPASILAFMGYRAIQIDDVIVREVLRKGLFSLQKVRRAQHLILHFLETRRYAMERGLYTRSYFDKIWMAEYVIHIVNPWLLLAAISVLLVSAVNGSLLSLSMLTIGMILLCFSGYRSWLLQQIYLLAAAVRNLRTKDLVWRK